MERVAVIAEGKEADRWVAMDSGPGRKDSPDSGLEQIFQAGRAAGEELSSGEDAVHPAGGDAGAEASTQGECLSSLQLLGKKAAKSQPFKIDERKALKYFKVFFFFF